MGLCSPEVTRIFVFPLGDDQTIGIVVVQQEHLSPGIRILQVISLLRCTVAPVEPKQVPGVDIGIQINEGGNDPLRPVQL